MTSVLTCRHRGWSTNPTCVPTIADCVALGTGSSVLSPLPSALHSEGHDGTCFHRDALGVHGRG